MSTIASPRDRPGPFPRRTNSSITPTSSSRPSLDGPASASSSPNPNNTSSSSTATTTTTTTQPKRNNRAALREYYNLRNNSPNPNNKPLPSPPTVSITSHPDDPDPNHPLNHPFTNPHPSEQNELDTPTFDAPAYTAHLLATASLADLLRTHARVLGEMRALDAERKALVYDNYSKLIAATDTIRRMRAARGPGEVVVVSRPTDGMAGGDGGSGMGNNKGGSLEGVVDGIYEVAVGLREELRREVDANAAAEGKQNGSADGEAGKRRERTRELAKEVVKVPERVRRLVGEGRVADAKEEWDRPRRLLVRWKELGVGGEEVGALIEEGDNALRGNGGGDKEESATAAT